MKNKLKYLIAAVLLIVFSAGFATYAYAAEGEAAATVETAEENIFSNAYNEITAYAGEILCALTFVGSVILAIAYKKGLIPLLKSSLVSIGNAITKIKESTSENAKKSSEIEKTIESNLNGAKNILNSLSDKVEELDVMLKEKFAYVDEAQQERQELKLILDSQIDMLYDIFMASALPQYQKDAVGEKIAKMKEAIAKNASRN